MTNGEIAYAAYARHRAQDGVQLFPWSETPADLRAAWEAFCGAAAAGADVEDCYHRAYLNAVGGLLPKGGPAPCFAFLRFHQKPIAAAWCAAHTAARSLS